MHGSIAGKAFQTLRHVQYFLHTGVFRGQILETRLLCDRILQLDAQRVRHQLGDPVHVGEAQFQDTAHVFNGRTGGQRIERDDLRNLIATVLLRHILDHFAAPVHAEIDVDVRHADAFRIQEALKQQAVLHRVHVGNRHGVADQTAGRRTAPWAYRNADGFRITDEVPDDEEVAGELHLLDHRDFAFQTFHVFGQIVLQPAGGAQSFQARPTTFKALPGHVSKVRIRIKGRRDIKARERILHLIQLYLATLRDLPGAINRIFEFAEEGHHLVAGLQVELGVIPVHALGIVDGLARRDAHQDLVSAGVILAEVVRVVGGDHRDAGLYRQAVDLGRQPFVLFEAVVLDFEEEVLLPEHLLIAIGIAFGFVVFIVENALVQVAAEACGQADQAFGVPRQEIFVDPGLVVEAFQIGRRHQIHQVLVAFLVFTEEDEVVVAIRVGADLHPLTGNVDFAAYNGPDALRVGCVIERDGPEKVAMVGHADGRHLLLLADLHELVDLAGSIEQRVVGVVVEVNERDVSHVGAASLCNPGEVNSF
ncbi:MAG: hypothetical protein JW395_1823 [Nitrospira sp.]|nr:hypothetical protein [Nitrospira sp.]